MSATRVAEDFLELLTRSDLLPPDVISSAVERYRSRGITTPERISGAFVAENLLTRFQAERLLSGRYRGFFLGDYRVEELLGTGGMGCLYIATDVNSGRRVALKVLSESVKQDAGILARFELEARAGMRLDHPHIVRTIETGETGHVRYMVMEFVEAINVFELSILAGPIPWQQACDFICQAAAGLEHAHEMRLVHRDVKPSNLLVDHQGRVKILDFGLALLDGVDDEDEFSLAMIFGHDCLGTADYMPPEQALDSYHVDARADIYSLGATLYFAMTGKVPYPVDSTSAKIEAHRKQPPPDPRALIPDIPAEVAVAVRRMMAKRPEDRFANLAEVQKAICPLARRKPLKFDFRWILDIRAADARRRAARERDSRKMWDIASGSTACGSNRRSVAETSSSSAERRTRQETLVSGDTRASRSTVSLDDPFSTSRPSGSHVSVATTSVEDGDLVEQFATSVSGFQLAPNDGKPAIPLENPRLVIGRQPDCDIVLPFGSISGHHCELQFEGDTWRIVDLDSKNGVYVDGRKVHEALLRGGELLTFGKTHGFVFERIDENPPEQSPSESNSERSTELPFLIVGSVAFVAAILAIVAWLLW